MKAPHEHPSDPALLGWIFAAAQAGCGVSLCGGCGRFDRLRPDLGEGKITHGICPSCEAKENAKAEEYFRGKESVAA
mgnify:FL=1